jgi:serine/threonine-protein kinase
MVRTLTLPELATALFRGMTSPSTSNPTSSAAASDERAIADTVLDPRAGPEARPRATVRAADSIGGRAATVALPAELVRATAGRLRVAALSCAGLLLLVFAVMALLPQASRRAMHHASFVAGATLALSLLVVALSFTRVAPARLLVLGLAYEVAGALGIALAEVYATPEPTGAVRGISWVCLWITLFPLVVPSPPGKTLVAAVSSATMGFVALAIAERGRPLGALDLVYLVTPNYVAAGLAVLFSRLIHRLGADVARARQLGSYQLVELLGRGGMGEVWRAKHRMLAQPAAIKLVRPEMLGDERATVLKRFEREARATAMLRSAHTVRVFDYGTTEDGTLYYVMELLDGVDLETLVRRHGPLPPERAVHLLRQVCDSLGEAHDSGLVHRDVKPANVYACRLGGVHDFAKVLDFGIVSLRGARAAIETRLTADNIIVGTPAYMAPETITATRPADERVDVYALGCVAYWLLTGALVFDAETPLQIAYAHLQERPVRPSERAARELPADLEQLVLDCLAKEPEGRPASVREIAHRLDASELAARWSQARAAAWWQAHPVEREPSPSDAARDTVIVPQRYP